MTTVKYEPALIWHCVRAVLRGKRAHQRSKRGKKKGLHLWVFRFLPTMRLGKINRWCQGEETTDGIYSHPRDFLPCDITKPCQINSDAECRNQRKKHLRKSPENPTKCFYSYLSYEKKEKFSFFALFSGVESRECLNLSTAGEGGRPTTQNGKRRRQGKRRRRRKSASFRNFPPPPLLSLSGEWRRHMSRESPTVLEQLVLQDYFI